MIVYDKLITFGFDNRGIGYYDELDSLFVIERRPCAFSNVLASTKFDWASYVEMEWMPGCWELT